MRFHTERRLGGPRDAIVARLADPAFYSDLRLPDVGRPEVLEAYDEGRTSVLRLRYAVVASAYPLLRLLAGVAPLAWLQEVRVDRSSGSGQVRYEAEFDPARLHGAGEFTVTPTGGTTVFRFDGDVVVAVPGMGRLLERQVVHQLLRRFDIEAAALDSLLRQEGAGDPHGGG